jgi:hypothetical protein
VFEENKRAKKEVGVFVYEAPPAMAAYEKTAPSGAPILMVYATPAVALKPVIATVVVQKA